MEEKLRSIIKPIPWSLLLKAAVVVLAWLTLPSWAFIIVAVYCYIVPFFRVGSLAFPFLVYLILSLLMPKGLLEAAYGFILFGLILGIKDLVIVNRNLAHGSLVFLLSFAGSIFIFARFTAWSSFASFFALALAAILWFFLIRSIPEQKDVPVIFPAFAALIFFEIGIAIFFLPLSWFPQATLLFLGSVLLFELAGSMDSISTKDIVVWSLGYVMLCLITVLLTSWNI